MLLKFCPNCGSKIFESANFCSNCGESLSKYKEVLTQDEKEESKTASDEIDAGNTLSEEIEVDMSGESQSEIILENVDDNQSLLHTNDDILISDQSIVEDCKIVTGDSVVEIIEEQPDMEQIEESVEASEEALTHDEIIENNSIEEEVIEDSISEFMIDETSSEINDEISEIDVSKDYEDENQEPKKKIIGLPEWAFYTALLVIGILIVVGAKLMNLPESSAKQSDIDTAAVKVDTTFTKVVETQVEKVAPETGLPKQSGSETDSAYHVIVATSDSVKAYDYAKTCSYKGAYVIKMGQKYSVAVFRSLKKEDALLYKDSVVVKTNPDAWIHKCTAK